MKNAIAEATMEAMNFVECKVKLNQAQRVIIQLCKIVFLLMWFPPPPTVQPGRVDYYLAGSFDFDVSFCFAHTHFHVDF